MMKCPQCETEHEWNAATCLSCGTDLLNATLSMQDASLPGVLKPGLDFGPRYRILRLVGSGGMGRVYKAHDKELDRTVALKLLRPELAADAACLQRFKQELLLSSRISHRNILRIHDLGEVGGTKFFSMALVEGEDLGAMLAREGRLPLERALDIARQICRALEAAHAECIIHRDLKPSNVLIQPDGHVYVSDFGLARTLESEAPGITNAGAVIGTPRYMSPEQAQGSALDQCTDIYSFGLILYEMVTGNSPFAGVSTLAMMYQRLNEAPPTLAG